VQFGFIPLRKLMHSFIIHSFMDFTVVGGQLAHLTKLRCFIRKQTKNDKQTKHYQKIVRNLSLSKVTICNKQESHSACNWTPDVTVVVDTMYRHESCNISVCKVHASQNKTLSKVCNTCVHGSCLIRCPSECHQTTDGALFAFPFSQVCILSAK